MLEVWFDGSCGPKNPGGRMGWGFVVFRDGDRIHEGKGRKAPSPGNSNNLAEYLALEAAMVWLDGAGFLDEPVAFCGDSQLVIHQMKGRWRIGRGLYREAALRVKDRRGYFLRASFRWAPRIENGHADALSRA